MPLTNAEIMPTVEQLGLKERAKLAEHLLRTLDEPGEDEVEALWLEEAKHRIASYRVGQSRAIPAEEVFRRAIADIS